MNEEITKEHITDLIADIKDRNGRAVKSLVGDLHPADIAEVMSELSVEEQSFVIDLLDNEVSANVLLELSLIHI